MDAFITAGGRPGVDEPLYQATRGGYKAMLDIAGKPMVQWVVDALAASDRIERLVLIGLPAEMRLTCSKSIAYLPDQGNMLNNILTAGREISRANPQASHLIAVSSDIPGITPEMVNWLADRVQETDDDIYYNAITRKTMESAFPTSHRTYLTLRDGEYCGGDINAISARILKGDMTVWEHLIGSRKSPLKQARIIGLDVMLGLIFKTMTLEHGARLICKRLKIKGRVLHCPFAQMGMDVDKPHQLAIMREALAHP
jgi:GTP:adenosylcobinamide-phosphate guanylyltransferase